MDGIALREMLNTAGNIIAEAVSYLTFHIHILQASAVLRNCYSYTSSASARQTSPGSCTADATKDKGCTDSVLGAVSVSVC